MINRNYQKDRLIMLPLTIVAIAIFVLFRFFNPIQSMPLERFNEIYYLFKPASLAIPWIVLSIVLVNIYIESLRAWSYLTVVFIPFGYWYWVTEVMCSGGFYCSPSVNGAFLGKLYLIVTVIVILSVYTPKWVRKYRDRK